MTVATCTASRRALLRAMAGTAALAAFPVVPRAQTSAPLKAMLVQTLTTTERRIRAVGVMRAGRTLYEYHRDGLQADALHDVRSVTKSVVSLLGGIAVEQQRLPPPDSPMAALLAEVSDASLDPRVRQLSWGHFLSLGTGFAPLSPNDSADYRRFLEYFHHPDGVRMALQRPIIHAPGQQWYYSNLDSQLAGLVVSRAVARAAPAGTGEGAAFVAWAREMLLDPLGAHDATWAVNAAGVPNMAAGLSLRLRDMLALGQLVVQQGRWQEKALVSSDYLQRATTAAINTTHPLRGGFIRYGWLWWLARTPDGNSSAVYAVGYGGQYIYMVPQHQIVIAVTSDVDDADHARGGARSGRVIRELLLPITHE